jgi:hypothetical protein
MAPVAVVSELARDEVVSSDAVVDSVDSVVPQPATMNKVIASSITIESVAFFVTPTSLNPVMFSETPGENFRAFYGGPFRRLLAVGGYVDNLLKLN